MLVTARVPIVCFGDPMSTAACNRLRVRIIKAHEWVTLDTLFSLVLPDDFNLADYLKTDKLFGVVFKYDGEIDVLLHPDKILSLGKRAARKTIKRETNGNKRKRIIPDRIIH